MFIADGDVGSDFCFPEYTPMKDPSSLNLDASWSSYSPRLSESLSIGFSSLSSDPRLLERLGLSDLRSETKKERHLFTHVRPTR